MIHIAVVGLGNISGKHLHGLLLFPERCKIVALCDIYPEKAEAAKEKYGLKGARVFNDHIKMLSSELKIDLVHICTPPSSHAEIAINAMNAGVNVLVEKPMAPGLKECDEMLEAEKRNGVVLSCISQNRFRNPVWRLKKLVDSGLAGNILAAHADSLWYRGHCYYDLWWRGTWEKEGGGPTLNHAVHQIDILNWIKGELPEEVTSLLANVAHNNSEVEDLSFSAFKYADGTAAEVTASVVHHGEGQSIVLQCEKARIAAPWSIAADVTQNNGFPIPGGNAVLEKELNEYYDKIEPLVYEEHDGEIDDVLTALEKGTRPLISGEDGKGTVELITAMYMAGFEKRTVKLPITPEDEYYTANGLMRHAPHFYEKKASIENFSYTDIIPTGDMGRTK
ncbi:Gfo/Idh/MocA family protein [Lacrimispora indolis]|uniref:Gfo/Idh/MocA family protein n=1 Tax=Lacrimispora indolis TaxID=69825 RepID=UPI00045E8B88|nr:Gfo/Idh/MocA family oxidoreductase [Lacrimispora indolis]